MQARDIYMPGTPESFRPHSHLRSMRNRMSEQGKRYIDIVEPGRKS